MKEKIKRLFPYLLVFVVLFYLLPLVIKDTGSGMFILLLVTPVSLLVTGFVYGIKEGFSIAPAILAGILFIPAIYIIHNDSAWFYVWFFSAFVLTGTGAGSLFYGKR